MVAKKPEKKPEKKEKTEKSKTEPSTKRGRGLGFDDKYGVEKFQIYKGDPETLVIPPKGHALYDPDGNTTFNPLRVAEIDKDGKFGDVIKVWTDPDDRKLYVVDGRGCKLDVCEVNRMRKARGDEVIQVKIMPLDMPLERAVEHVVLRNFQRKKPTLSHYAREVVRLKNLGKSWSRIAEMLDIPTETEKDLRIRAALAYCIPAVVEAIESGKVNPKRARQFGGNEIDGSKRLSEAEQLDLLSKKVKPRDEDAPKIGRPKGVASHTQRREIASHLANGKMKLKGEALAFARGLAAALLRLDGDETAASPYPEVDQVINAVLAKKTSEKKEKDA